MSSRTPTVLLLSRRYQRISPPIRSFSTQPRTSRTSSFAVQRRPLRPLRSGVSVTNLVVAGVVSIGVAYLSLQYRNSQVPEEAKEEEEQHSSTSTMAAPYGNAPGRPGNLTPEQEAKLKEMWVALSDIAGIDHATTNGATPPRASTDIKPDSAVETPTKKKSRFGFGRSKKDKTEETGTDGVTNDKHGQTKEYEQALASLTPKQIRDALWIFSKHDDPDALLLRFLRARKWDVQNALIMLISTMHWRLVEQHVDDDIMLNGEGHAFRESQSSDATKKKEGDDFMAQLRMGKSFLHGVDKDGRPCCYVRVRLHRQGEQSEKSLERFTVYTIETARMMLRPPVDTATIVFDMTDFSMANMVRHTHDCENITIVLTLIGLHPSKIHDQMLRSKLSRISRQRRRLQISLDLPRYLENHQRLARSRGSFQGPLREQRRRSRRIHPTITNHERTRRRRRVDIFIP